MSDIVVEEEDKGPQLGQVERPKRLAENVAEQLLNYITSQDLEPGTPLATQAAMLEDLEVGQASLREALRFLEMMGFIELRVGRNGGPVVGDPAVKNFTRMTSMYFHALGVTVKDVLDARVVLEPAMVRNLAERGLDEEGMKTLRPFSSSESRDWLTAEHSRDERDFHWVIAELSGNAVLKITAQAMRDIYSGVAQEIHLSDEESVKIERMHVHLADAILAGDGKTVERLMTEHLQAVIDTYQVHYPHLLAARITWP